MQMLVSLLVSSLGLLASAASVGSSSVVRRQASSCNIDIAGSTCSYVDPAKLNWAMTSGHGLSETLSRSAAIPEAPVSAGARTSSRTSRGTEPGFERRAPTLGSRSTAAARSPLCKCATISASTPFKRSGPSRFLVVLPRAERDQPGRAASHAWSQTPTAAPWIKLWPYPEATTRTRPRLSVSLASASPGAVQRRRASWSSPTTPTVRTGARTSDGPSRTSALCHQTPATG
ncbi:hypothetical protein BC831DRAFT_470307 [Entophlyctis helioformis]|nr:hypothetical protein BC831DRAFT_470307 [Entophlyctis helioformis]